MHIGSMLAGAMLCLGMLAFAPVAMASPAPDICVLDLSQPVTLDLVLDTADMTCLAVDAVDAVDVVPIMTGDEHEAAFVSTTLAHATFIDFADHRQHEDPGRCPV